MKNKTYKIIGSFLLLLVFLSYGKTTLAESSRRLPDSYVVHSYGTTGFFHSLQDWEDLTTVNLTSVTTVDQNSSGNILYVSDTSLFEDAEMDESTITVDGQLLIITGVTADESLTVSAISGTINSGTAVQTGFILTCYEDGAPYNDSVNLGGAINTSENYFRVVRATEGHRGTPTSGVRFYQNGLNGSIIKSTENYVGIYDIAVTGSGVTTIVGIDVQGTYSKIIGCTAYNITCFTGTYQIAMGLRAIGNFSVIANSYATGVSGAWNYYGAISFTNSSGTNTYYCYNNTAKNNKINFYVDGNYGNAIVYAKNNIFMNASYQNIMQFHFSGTTTLHQTTNRTSGVTFDSDGYHLSSSDNIAINQGTSLDPDPSGFFSFNDDIDGSIRPYDVLWDVGVDEQAITYILTYNSGLNGSIAGDTYQVVNNGSDGTVVTAVPNTNYHFIDWSDGSTDNPRTDTSVTGNIDATANFAEDVTSYTLIYTSVFNGSITGDSPQTVDEGNDGTSVTAIPNANYHFVDWSDGSTDNPRTDTNVTGDITVTANFAIDTYTVEFEDYDGLNLKTETVNHGSSATAPTDPTRIGYTFTGWDVNFSNITSDLTVTAEYSVNPEPIISLTEEEPEESPIIKIKEIQETCNSLKLELSTGGEEKNKDLDIKVKIENINTGEKTEQKFSADTNREGRVKIIIINLDQNTNYKIKVKYKRDNRDEYSDWSDSKKTETTNCPVSLITTPLHIADQSFPGELDQEEEKDSNPLEVKKEIILTTKQEPKETSQEDPKTKGFWNTVTKGVSSMKESIKEKPIKFFFLPILLLIVIIIAFIVWWKRRESEDEQI